jgi:hypothetical protein
MIKYFTYLSCALILVWFNSLECVWYDGSVSCK